MQQKQPEQFSSEVSTLFLCILDGVCILWIFCNFLTVLDLAIKAEATLEAQIMGKSFCLFVFWSGSKKL